MPNHEQLNEARRAVAEAAATYQREVSPVLEMLSEFRDSIIMLRNKGAPLTAIIEVLKKANVSVSLATLARFCRGLPKPTKARKRKRKPTTSVSLTAKSRTAKAFQRPKESAPSRTKSTDDQSGGPRIPNLATL